jgi:hypothetical protein
MSGMGVEEGFVEVVLVVPYHPGGDALPDQIKCGEPPHVVEFVKT